MREAQFRVKGTGGMKSSPYVLLLFLLAFTALVLNLLVVVNPLVVEGVIIGAPPPVWTSLDLWFVKYFFGDFTGFPYGVFIPVLLEFYFFSFLLGFMMPIFLLRGTSRELLRKGEVTFSEKRLLLVYLDVIIAGYFTFFAFDRILSYLVQYPYQLPGMWSTISGSYIFLFSITGFITGNALGKCIFPLRVYFECRKRHLKLEVRNLEESNARGKQKRRKGTKWVLLPITGAGKPALGSGKG